MKKWVEFFENIFVFVTFAEMGEHHTSQEILNGYPANSPYCGVMDVSQFPSPMAVSLDVHIGI